MDKKTSLSVALMSLALSSSIFAAPSFAAGTGVNNCNESARQANANAIFQEATTNYQQMVQQPANLDGCLGSLSALNFNIGSFDFSSIFNQLIQQACQVATGAVNNVTNGAINKVNGYIPPVASGVVSVGSGGAGGVNVSNGAANNLLSPTIGGVTSGVQNKSGSALSHVFGN